jgi:hypothetical protein
MKLSHTRLPSERRMGGKAMLTIASWFVPMSSSGLSASRSRASRSASRTPKTVRMITSSVIACVRIRRGNTVPTGQPSTSRSVIACICSP